MSDDLIRRSEVLSALKKAFGKYNIEFGGNRGGFAEAVPKAIEAIPTAYDVDNVVEQLKSHKDYYEQKTAQYDERGDTRNMDISDSIALAYGKAIKIVKAGGMNEQRDII